MIISFARNFPDVLSESLRSQPQGKYKRFLLIVERGRDLASTNSYVTAKGTLNFVFSTLQIPTLS